MTIRQHIPNLFTLGNLVCGSIAIIHVLQFGFDTWAVLLIFVAGILDVFDGAVARALGVSNPIGKQLDSLADVVSFGLAPSVIAFSMLEVQLPTELQWLKYLALLNVVCAALRLARFNISTDQSSDFSGMPSPANGIFWGSIAAVAWEMSVRSGMNISIPSYSFIIVLLLISSLLMVAPVRMFSFKFKKGGFAQNKIPFIFIGTVLFVPFVTWFLFHSVLLCVPIGILWYTLLSVIYHFSLNGNQAA